VNDATEQRNHRAKIPEALTAVAFTRVISPFFQKLAKHLALLACLLILQRASGRAEIGQLWIFGLALIASLLYLGGRALRLRSTDGAQPARGAG